MNALKFGRISFVVAVLLSSVAADIYSNVAEANFYLDVQNNSNFDNGSSAYLGIVDANHETFTLNVYALMSGTNPNLSVDTFHTSAANFFVASSALKGDVSFGSWSSNTGATGSKMGAQFTTAYGGLGLGGSSTTVTSTSAWWISIPIDNGSVGSGGSLYTPPDASNPVGSELLLGTVVVTFSGYALPATSTTAAFESMTPTKIGIAGKPDQWIDSSGTWTTVWGSASNVGNGANLLTYTASGAGLNFVVGSLFYPAKADLSAIALSGSRVVASGGTLSVSGSLSNTAYSGYGTQQDSLARWNVGGDGLSSQSGTSLAASGTVPIGPLTYTTGAMPGLTSITLMSSGTGANQTGVVTGSSSASVAVLNNRVVTSTSASLGLVHFGQAVVPATITLSTSGDDSLFTRLAVNNAGSDANGISVSGGTHPQFSGPTVTDARTISGTPRTLGLLTGAITLPVVGEGLYGESPIPVQVPYSVQVYSGNAEWNATTGLWGTGGNWKDVVGGGSSGVPGVLGFETDTTTFGAAVSVGTAAVALDGVAPVLSSMTFDNANASYLVLQGAGTTALTLTGTGDDSPTSITVMSGSHWIQAPIVLDNDLVVSSSGSIQLNKVLSNGGLSKSLTLVGGGELMLSGTGTYTGGTFVDSGTLVVTNPTAILSGTSLFIGADASSIFDRTGAYVTVPEPSALALLAADGLLLLIWWLNPSHEWRKRPKCESF
jgi:autotransporter-associated beta strand protein